MPVIYTFEKSPALDLPTISGERFNLAERNPTNFTIAVFYRGKHCPVCKNHLKEIQEHYQQFLDAGMDVVAVSMDTKENAEQFAKDTGATFPIAYDLTEKQARTWGLYISPKREGSEEPDVFSEPALFVLRPDTTVFMVQVQSAPFTRPSMSQLLWGLNYALENDYPTRGRLTRE